MPKFVPALMRSGAKPAPVAKPMPAATPAPARALRVRISPDAAKRIRAKASAICK